MYIDRSRPVGTDKGTAREIIAMAGCDCRSKTRPLTSFNSVVVECTTSAMLLLLLLLLQQAAKCLIGLRNHCSYKTKACDFFVLRLSVANRKKG